MRVNKQESIDNLFLQVNSRSFFIDRLQDEVNRKQPNTKIISFYLHRILHEGTRIQLCMNNFFKAIKSNKIKVAADEMDQLRESYQFEQTLRKNITNLYTAVNNPDFDVRDVDWSDFSTEWTNILDFEKALDIIRLKHDAFLPGFQAKIK